MVCSFGYFLKQNDVTCLHSLLPLKQFWFSHKNMNINTPEYFSGALSDKSVQLLRQKRIEPGKSALSSWWAVWLSRARMDFLGLM